MVEQTNACECHCNAVFVASFNNMVIAYRAACLCNEFHTTLVSTFDIVAEWEERVRTKSYTFQCVKPCAFFFACQHFRFFCEELLPYSVCQYIVVIFADVDVDSVVAVCTADLFNPWQVQYFRMLAQIPDVCLVSCKASTVDTSE